MKPIKVFCANEQEETDHEQEQISEEIILTCSKCNRVIKFPEGLELKKLIKAHKEANEGQSPIKE
jgi:hypothetical protein